ncbi:hypothetical protein AVEN_22456-1, partial [Araneus ventricosus]
VPTPHFPHFFCPCLYSSPSCTHVLPLPTAKQLFFPNPLTPQLPPSQHNTLTAQQPHTLSPSACLLHT